MDCVTMLDTPIEQLVRIPLGKAPVVSNYALPDQVFFFFPEALEADGGEKTKIVTD